MNYVIDSNLGDVLEGSSRPFVINNVLFHLFIFAANLQK